MKRIFWILLIMFAFWYTQVFAMNEYTFNVVILIDTTSPVTQNDYDGLWHNQDFTINLIAADTESGVKDIYYRINNGKVLTVSSSGQPSISTEGKNNLLEYWSVDKVDNEEFPHKQLTGIKLDKTLPVINIISPAKETVFNEDHCAIVGTATDDLSGIKNLSVTVGQTDYIVEVNSDGGFSLNNIKIISGPNNIKVRALDSADNAGESSIQVFLGWVLHLKIPYFGVSDYYSGAACAQMVLNYMRKGIKDELNQKEIYDYGYQNNDPKNSSLLELDPRAIRYTLGHFDPYDLTDPSGSGDAYRAYNFGIAAFKKEEFTNYLKDIIHWMAYPVVMKYPNGELVAQPNTPAVVPAYGAYNHWIVVNGAATTANPMPYPRTNPWHTPDFTVYGLWLTDPAAGGIGQDLYVTAQSAQETFFLPMTSPDNYDGKYLQIAEPPEVESGAKVEMAAAKINKETLAILKISQDLSKEVPDSLPDFQKRMENARKHLYDAALVVNLESDLDFDSSKREGYSLDSVFNADSPRLELDWKKIVDPSLLTDENFVKAFNTSQARSFVKVKRADRDEEFYYLIPFDKYVNGQFLTYAAVIINARDGSFKEASWVEKPICFIQITKAKAVKLVLAKNPALENIKLDAELIWQPAGFSESPFYPYWKVFSENRQIYFVTQKGEVIKNEEIREKE